MWLSAKTSFRPLSSSTVLINWRATSISTKVTIVTPSCYSAMAPCPYCCIPVPGSLSRHLLQCHVKNVSDVKPTSRRVSPPSLKRNAMGQVINTLCRSQHFTWSMFTRKTSPHVNSAAFTLQTQSSLVTFFFQSISPAKSHYLALKQWRFWEWPTQGSCCAVATLAVWKYPKISSSLTTLRKRNQAKCGLPHKIRCLQRRTRFRIFSNTSAFWI